MARVASDQETVLKKLLVRLRDQVSGFNRGTCFLSMNADPPGHVDHNIWATITVMDGSFGDGEFEGGAENVLLEYSGFSVNIFSRVMLDEHGHSGEILTNATLGLLAKKKEVLKALAGHDLVINDDGDTTLFALIQPLNSPKPEFSEELKRGVVTIHFSLDIDWDMS